MQIVILASVFQAARVLLLKMEHMVVDYQKPMTAAIGDDQLHRFTGLLKDVVFTSSWVNQYLTLDSSTFEGRSRTVRGIEI